jgi:hypothetical protein
LYLHYKDKPINALQENNRCLFRASEETYKYRVCGENAELSNVKAGAA